MPNSPCSHATSTQKIDCNVDPYNIDFLDMNDDAFLHKLTKQTCNFKLPEETDLAFARTAFNTPDKHQAPTVQQICPMDFLIPEDTEEDCLEQLTNKVEFVEPPKPAQSFIVSQKGRKMKKSDVMAALKLEYLRDSNWDKKKKTELSAKFGVTYS